MRKRSESALDLARTEAARADVDAFDLTVDDRADALDVRLPGTLRLQMGVADVVARELTFVADFANMCHVDTPPCCRNLGFDFKMISVRSRGSRTQ